MGILWHKCKEVLSAVSPVVALVILLSLTLTPLPGLLLYQFIIGALAIIIGLSILLFGIELGITPFGNRIGEAFLKSNKMWFVVVAGFVLGFFINVAEPDLQVVATQVSQVMGGYISMSTILVSVSIGTGLMLMAGIIRIVRGIPLRFFFTVIYGVIVLLALFSSSDMLAIGFDTSGATTGALTVPLVLGVCIGVAAMKKDSKSAEEDSFGLVGVMSTGAPLGVLLLNQFVKTGGVTGVLETHFVDSSSLLGPFLMEIPKVALESLVAFSPIVVLFIVFQQINFHMPDKAFRKILVGFLYTYIGFVVFLVGVNGGFMRVGNLIGYQLASYSHKSILVGFGFLLGLLVILTEPAVHILTEQIEDVTSGYIKKNTVLVFLCVGVAIAVGLSMLRIVVPGIQLWHYLLPGFMIAIGLTYYTPPLFVGIAFDSGGVASGPMTATFILALAQGASDAIEYSNLLTDSFGVISMVAMTPLIALQILGLIYKYKSAKSKE